MLLFLLLLLSLPPSPLLDELDVAEKNAEFLSRRAKWSAFLEIEFLCMATTVVPCKPLLNRWAPLYDNIHVKYSTVAHNMRSRRQSLD